MVRPSPTEWPVWRATSLADLWREQLAVTLDEDPYPAAERQPRGWLLDAGLAEILEPFAGLAHRHHDLTRIAGLDGAAARALLARLPASELEDRQNDAPTMRALLEVIAAHPVVVTGIGYVVGPDRWDERLTLEGLLIDDPELLDFEPDVLSGPTPALVRTLGEHEQEEYHLHRRGCVEHSVMRQQWYAARHRYGIAGARRPPTEVDVRYVFGSGAVLRLWWT